MIASFFENTWSKDAMVEATTFAELAETLRYASTLTMDRTSKEKVMCIVPAEFDPPQRLKANVVSRYAFTGDVDGDTPTILTMAEMVSILRELGLAFIVHTTTKSTVHQNRYRVILPYARPLTVAESEAASSSIHQRLGEVFDTKTFDAGRLSIFPQAWTGLPAGTVTPDDAFANPLAKVWDQADEHHAFEADVTGAPIDADQIMADYPPIIRAEVENTASVAEVEAFMESRTVRADVDFMTLTDLDRSPIIRPAFVEEFLTSAPGGRFYRFLNRVAGRALAKDYPIDAHTLVAIGKEMDGRAGNRGRTGIVREAQRALAYAVRQHQTRPPDEDREAQRLSRLAKRFGVKN